MAQRADFDAADTRSWHASVDGDRGIDLFGFDHGVERVRGITAHRPQIECFENIQDLESSDTLPVVGGLVARPPPPTR